MSHFEIVKNFDDGMCGVEQVSEAGGRKPFPNPVCRRCFQSQSIGLFVDGACTKCGHRVAKSPQQNEEEKFEKFLETLDVASSTRDTYISQLRLGKGRIYERYEEWKEGQDVNAH